MQSLLRDKWRRFRFRICARSLMRGAPVTKEVLAELSHAWGNEGWSAHLSYLHAVCEAASCVRGPILECGSGLSTVLLGIFAARRGVQVISLEHISEWEGKLNEELAALGLPNRVTTAPLKSYGEFDWYSHAAAWPAGISLVICDGPPSTTRGGRSGLLPVCGRNFASTCTILLDDAERQEEQAILSSWQAHFQVAVTVHGNDDGTYATCKYTSTPI